jgi:hypothetical protein
MFKRDLDVDPFRHAALASLTISMYRSKVIPHETIVANEQNKKVSLHVKNGCYIRMIKIC